MKKWGALTIVLILGVMLVLQYFLKKKEAGVIPPPAATGGSGTAGVALPAGNPAVSAYDAQHPLTMPAAGGASSTYGPLPTIKGEDFQRGECKDGAMNDILSSHGKIWGTALPTGGFSAGESVQIYSLLSKYFTCAAFARHDVSFCDNLPADGTSGKVKIAFEQSPDYACRKGYTEIAFLGFMAGKSADNSPCQLTVAEGALENIPSISGTDFCDAAAKGMENVCPILMKNVKPEQAKMCGKFFPAGRNDCRGDSQCLWRYEVYKAIQSGKADKCPRTDEDFCRAYILRTEAPCGGILKELSRAYCRDLAQLIKTVKGPPGLTQEEAKAWAAKEAMDLAEKERLKTEKAKMHQEEQKTMEDINKSIRATKGK
ncbi:MAG: hypothetical protein NTX59_07850 [Elusimicrobia bacterium]|nr:hypothetical protein [Elusimicrobiota bacterium]